MIIEPVLMQIAVLASESCKGIEALTTALTTSNAVLSAQVLDLPEIQLCLTATITTPVPETLPPPATTLSTPVLTPAQVLEPQAPVVATAPIPSSANVDRSRPL